MPTINLKDKTRAQLEKLLSDIDKETKRRATQDRKDALAAARAAAKQFGFSLEELLEKPTKRREAVRRGPKGKQPAKYQDPETGKTWSGMGRRPAWFAFHIESGKDEVELLISS